MVCIPWTDPLMMQRVPMCGRFADYGVYHTLLVLNDVAAAKAIDVLKVTKCFVWIREKAPKPRMVLNFFPISLPKFTIIRV